MKPEFQPGASEKLTITTTKEMGITHLGPDAPSMYSTPSMVQLIEGTCVKLMSANVDAGEQSVGFHVDVHHLAPTPIGKQVTAGCVRLTNADVEELFTIVPPGTEVTIVD